MTMHNQNVFISIISHQIPKLQITVFTKKKIKQLGCFWQSNKLIIGSGGEQDLKILILIPCFQPRFCQQFHTYFLLEIDNRKKINRPEFVGRAFTRPWWHFCCNLNLPWGTWTKYKHYLGPSTRRECVRNLDLRVQVHLGELWVSKQRVHIVLEASKSAGAKGDVPKICGFVHPLHPC